MEFDLLGDLPRGVTVLEASAGTGKTYTIEGLVARYVAERHHLRRLLVVTFTRAATAELRDRVRTRMVRVAEHLGAVLDGASPQSDDEVAAYLSVGVPLELVRERRNRLAESLSDFDAATISTIHGFCQQVLAGVGLTGDLDRQATLIEDERDVIDAVVDDVLVERFAAVRGDVVVARRTLRAIAKALIDNPDAEIVPESSEDPEVAIRRDLALRVRDEVDRRKRAFRLLSYNDLLVRLRDTLRDPGRGAAAAERLRSQYDIALIDEFQDTDPVQWEILERVFSSDGSGGRALVLIGDPKQAIYSFRGADVYAYLKAASGREPQTLQTNWRSDQGLLDAFNVVFAGAELGHEAIAYRNVDAAPGHDQPRLVGAPVAAPLRVRIARRDDGHRINRGNMIVAEAARAHVARDVAVEAVSLLQSGAELIDRGRDGLERSRRRVRPRDIAVLVRSNAEAALVQRELHDAGVPAVINGVGSVFATAAATEWLRLLEALEQPTSVSRARTASLTVFVGWSGEQLAAARADDRALDPVHESLLAWAAILRDRSVASLLQTIVAQENLPGRVLGMPGGERHMTDIEHVAELLHAAAISEELGPSALTGWLRARINESSDDLEAEERARRLESDAEAVQVLTVHRSKGLEYPVVFAPFLWSSSASRPVPVPVFHDEDRDGDRSADVGGDTSPGFNEHKLLHQDEAKGEELRLVYVALTRARHQAVVWWLPAAFADKAPLSRLLLCRSSRTGDVLNAANLGRLKTDDLTRADLDMLAARADGKMVIEQIPFSLPEMEWHGEVRDALDLASAQFERDLDLRWRRTSYSAITKAVHDAPRVGSEPDVDFTDDEALAPPAVVAAASPAGGDLEERLRAVPLPLGEMPGGVDVGTFVHGIFEDMDFAAEDLRAHAAEVFAKRRDKREVGVGDDDAFVEGLALVCETPLGPLAGGLRLADLGVGDRLAELDFELPLVGGSAGRTERLAVAAIGRLLRTHLPDDDPVRPYAEKLFDQAFARDLRGYLAGSIDAVLRVDGRYLVVDYKTNWLGSPDEELSAWHYRPEALVSAMDRGHYPLQALLYAVALHRYLRWRVAGYSASAHLGGVLYLFVRGMVGASTPEVDGVPCGVFSWEPPAALVEALSDLIDEGEAAA